MLPLLRTLGSVLERACIGQSDAVEALLIGWLAGTNVLLEGPPGCGKTTLVDALLESYQSPVLRIAGARELSRESLLGDHVIRCERTSSGERIGCERGVAPLAGARLVFVDEIDRIPGAVLAQLVPALDVPELELAVAARVPASHIVAGEPLAPAVLDRFPIRCRMHGLVSGRRWESAALLLEASASGLESAPALRSRVSGTSCAPNAPCPDVPGLLACDWVALRELRASVPRVVLSGSVIEQAWHWLERVRAAPPADLPISDRCFGEALPKLLRAHALLSGRAVTGADDLPVLRHLVGGMWPAPGRPEAASTSPGSRSAGVGSLPDSLGATARPAPGSGSQAAGAPVPAVAARRDRALERGIRGNAELVLGERESVRLLARAIEGRLEGGSASWTEDPGGAPRRRRRLRGLDEALDADPRELWAFLEGRLPDLPSVLERNRRSRGGALLILRDVSASMEGPLARWAGELSRALVELIRLRRTRFGYIEFNHVADCFTMNGRLLHRCHSAVLERIAMARSSGQTNYEAPLRAALAALRPADRPNHVVLISDGAPVLGDPCVHRERERARRTGTRVHPVYLGVGSPPGVLIGLARDTGGAPFQVLPRPGRRFVLRPMAVPDAAGLALARAASG